MTNDEIRTVVLRVLRGIAPEADPAALDPDADLRDQLDIDSMDLLNFVLGLNEALGVDIPERDYPKLSSLNACVGYLAARQPAARVT
jgi:acyl carrier protein